MTTNATFTSAGFRSEDIGKVLIIDPRPWWLKVWHWLLRLLGLRKVRDDGHYVIKEIIDATTIQIEP